MRCKYNGRGCHKTLISIINWGCACWHGLYRSYTQGRCAYEPRPIATVAPCLMPPYHMYLPAKGPRVTHLSRPLNGSASAPCTLLSGVTHCRLPKMPPNKDALIRELGRKLVLRRAAAPPLLLPSDWWLPCAE